MRTATSIPRLRVLIAEAHPVVALGLADLLRELGYELVGSVSSANEAIIAAAEHHPNLMLIDVRLGGDTDGITAAVEIHNKLGIRSVFFTEHSDGTVRERAAGANPIAFLDKASPVSVIADALRTASTRVSH